MGGRLVHFIARSGEGSGERVFISFARFSEVRRGKFEETWKRSMQCACRVGWSEK